VIIYLSDDPTSAAILCAGSSSTSNVPDRRISIRPVEAGVTALHAMPGHPQPAAPTGLIAEISDAGAMRFFWPGSTKRDTDFCQRRSEAIRLLKITA